MPPSLAPRSDFPRLKELSYLATASVGLMPLPVQFAAQAFERDIATGGVTGFDEAAEVAVFEGARNGAATLLNADPDDIAIVASATQAIDQVAWWLRPGPGTNIVSIDIEFPSSTYQWYRIAEETGAEVRLVRVLDDPASLSLDRIAALVDDRTAALCVSHMQFATGHVLDAAALAALAHAHGALLILDASQSAGMVPIDVRASHIDVLVACGYKALCGPFGAAICYLRPAIRERFNPPFVGWRSAVEPYALDAVHMSLPRSARSMEFSTMSYGAAVALGAAIEYVLDLGVARILTHDLSLASRLIDGLDVLDATVLTPRDDRQRAGTVTARFPGRDSEAVAAQLNAAGVIVSPRFGSTRFSTHYFNHEADVDRALEVLEGILRSSPAPTPPTPAAPSPARLARSAR
jgi:selenocysteine lyase/cysteine desulfurase